MINVYQISPNNYYVTKVRKVEPIDKTDVKNRRKNEPQRKKKNDAGRNNCKSSRYDRSA